MATPLGNLGLSFVFCLIIAILFVCLFVCCIYLFIFPAFTALACILVYVAMHHVDSTHFAT
jgi:hypothetical protein